MRGTRPYRHICLPPLVRARLACSYCMRSQPRVALPNRLTHAAGSFITRRPCGRSWTVRTHSVFYRPAGRECERRASRYTCGSLSTDGEDRDSEDHFFHTIAIRHTQHVRLKGPEPRWSDIIMTMKEKQQRDSKQTRSVHIPNS